MASNNLQSLSQPQTNNEKASVHKTLTKKIMHWQEKLEKNKGFHFKADLP